MMDRKTFANDPSFSYGDDPRTQSWWAELMSNATDEDHAERMAETHQYWETPAGFGREIALACGYLEGVYDGPHNPLLDYVDWDKWGKAVRDDGHYLVLPGPLDGFHLFDQEA